MARRSAQELISVAQFEKVAAKGAGGIVGWHERNRRHGETSRKNSIPIGSVPGLHTSLEDREKKIFLM